MIFFFIIFFILIVNTYSQSTDDCGKNVGCFRFPNNCKNLECKFIYKWSNNKLNNSSQEFSISAKIEDDIPISSVWLGIGFSTDQFMSNDDVVMCKNSPAERSIQHYFNSGQFAPSLLDPRNPSLGLSEQKILLNQGFLVCSFNREKSLKNVQNYFDLNNPHYILAAYGQISPNGDLLQHISKLSSQNPINFNIDSIVETNSDFGVKVKTHASFMIISWIVFAPLGMILGRYFKFIFPDRRLFDLKIWFIIHRPLMLSTFILTIIGLFVILADNNWKWINKQRLTEFVHSIFGMILIGLAFIQIIIAAFRPHQEHENRYIFNFAHSIIGAVILLLSVLTLFIGTGINRLNIGLQGIGFMIGWTVWLIMFITIIELINRKYKNKINDITLSNLSNLSNDFHKNVHKNLIDQSQLKLENFKITFLIFHLLVSIGLTIGLIYTIAKSRIF